MHIRPYESQDQTQLVILMATLGYEQSAEILDARVNELRADNSEVFVADVEGQAVACVQALVDYRLAEGRVGEIVSLVVLPEQQGLGIGKKLVEAAEIWLSSHTDRLRVRANAKREEAHALYQKWGYQPLKTQKIFLKHSRKESSKESRNESGQENKKENGINTQQTSVGKTGDA